ERAKRLCDEEGIRIHIEDDGNSVLMGPQRERTLLELLDECADAEDAIMYDHPDINQGIMWRSLSELWNKAPSLELDYEQGHISPPLEVIVDDRGVVNEASITQTEGSMRRYTDYDGPLGVNNVGRYSISKTLNLFDLSQLIPRASWEVHKGTAESPRISQLTVDCTANPDLEQYAIHVYPGDFILVKNLPRNVTTEPIKLLVVGVKEYVDEVTRRFTFVTVPGSPYDVAHVWDGSEDTDQYARVDLDDCTVAADSDGVEAGTDTTLVVDVPSGRGSTASDDQAFDISVGGAVLTVTDVSAKVNGKQGFIVSTTVKNGVVKE